MKLKIRACRRFLKVIGITNLAKLSEEFEVEVIVLIHYQKGYRIGYEIVRDLYNKYGQAVVGKIIDFEDETIFALILPFITQMKIDGLGNFGNAMFLIVMIIGGAMVVPAALSLFVRLFGQADDTRGGGGFVRGAFYGTRFVGGMTIGLAAKGASGVYRLGRSIARTGSSGITADSDSGSDTDEDKFSE